MKGKIAYKVVCKGHYSFYKHRHPKKYVKRYLIGRKVKAPKNTLGLFCYDSLTPAKLLAECYARKKQKIKILEVEILKELLVPLRVATPDPSRTYDFNSPEYSATLDVHRRTICAQEIKVLRVIKTYNYEEK